MDALARKTMRQQDQGIEIGDLFGADWIRGLRELQLDLASG
jgi:hypothetical protein